MTVGDITSGPILTAAIQIALALAGIGVVLRHKPLLMLLVGALQFVPLGIYMLGTPGVFRWIGIAIILYMFTSMLVLMDKEERATRC